MIEIDDLQRELLTAAAATDDARLMRPDTLTLAKWKAATTPLVKAGYLISLPIEGAGSDLLMTDAGRALVAVPQAAAAKRKGTRRKASAAPAADRAPTNPPELADQTLPEVPASPKGKIGVLVSLLRQPEGTTIADMMSATGWQAHSVRGAISGSVKKALGLEVASEKVGEVRTYRIATQDAA